MRGYALKRGRDRQEKAQVRFLDAAARHASCPGSSTSPLRVYCRHLAGVEWRMLALNDAALARLCIGANSPPPRSSPPMAQGRLLFVLGGKPVNASYLCGHLEAFPRRAYRPWPTDRAMEAWYHPPLHE